MSVDLPAPLSPIRPTISLAPDLQIDVPERDHMAERHVDFFHTDRAPVAARTDRHAFPRASLGLLGRIVQDARGRTRGGALAGC
jgi:hypothetical protein